MLRATSRLRAASAAEFAGRVAAPSAILLPLCLSGPQRPKAGGPLRDGTACEQGE